MPTITEMSFSSIDIPVFVPAVLSGTVEAIIGKHYFSNTASVLTLPEVGSVPINSMVLVTQTLHTTEVVDTTSRLPGILESIERKAYVYTGDTVCFIYTKLFGYPQWVIVANYEDLADVIIYTEPTPGPKGPTGVTGDALFEGETYTEIPAGAMLPFEPNGATPETLLLTNEQVIDVLTFDNLTEQSAVLRLAMPVYWKEAAGLQIQLYWTVTAGGIVGDVIQWRVYGYLLNDLSPIVVIPETTLHLVDNYLGEGIQHTVAFCGNIPVTGVFTDGSVLNVVIKRVFDGDSLTAPVQLICAKLKYTLNTYVSSSSSSSSSSSLSSSSSSSSSTSSSSSSSGLSSSSSSTSSSSSSVSSSSSSSSESSSSSSTSSSSSSSTSSSSSSSSSTSSSSSSSSSSVLIFGFAEDPEAGGFDEGIFLLEEPS